MAGLTALAGTVSPATPSLQREGMLGEGGAQEACWVREGSGGMLGEEGRHAELLLRTCHLNFCPFPFVLVWVF